MNDEQEKFIKILTEKIMEIINEVNNEALSKNVSVGAQTYFLLIDIACEIASQLKIPKKEQMECIKYFMQQNKNSIKAELNSKIKDYDVTLDESLEEMEPSDKQDSSYEDQINEINMLFKDDFIAQKDKN